MWHVMWYMYLHGLLSKDRKLSVMTLHSSSTPVPSTPITKPRREAADGSNSNPLLNWNIPVTSRVRWTKQLPLSWENLHSIKVHGVGLGGNNYNTGSGNNYNTAIATNLPYFGHMVSVRCNCYDITIVSNSIHICARRQVWFLRHIYVLEQCGNNVSLLGYLPGIATVIRQVHLGIPTTVIAHSTNSSYMKSNKLTNWW